MAIEQIRHQNRIAVSAQPLGHLIQAGPRPERIHIQDHSAFGVAAPATNIDACATPSCVLISILRFAMVA